MDAYKTVTARNRAETTEKRSRFIATIHPCSSENEATGFIAEMKSKYWDARHNVYAYSLLEGNSQRYSDDGEPHSTAGIPVLEVIKQHGLTNCAIVVTRYFGGILLGTGGLVRAYSEAAKQCIGTAKIVEMKLSTEIFVTCNYADYDKFCMLADSLGAVVQQADFKSLVELNLVVSSSLLTKFTLKITDAFSGNIKPIVGNEKYFGF